jgi:hypothetical protein
MKIYEFIATCRSGHHSVLNWILMNKIGFQYNWEYKFVRLGENGMFHLSEANHDIPLSFEYIDEALNQIDTLFVGYEDTPWDYTIFSDDTTYRGPMSFRDYKKYDMEYQGRFVLLRNFYTNLASRLKSNENKMFGKWNNDQVHLFDVGEKFIFRWKSQARACVENKVQYLKFEDWLTNKEIRENFLYDNFGLKDIYGIDGISGTRSSFGTFKGVTDRDKEVEIPEEVKDLIRKDSELHYLIGALGYEYKNI